MWIWELPDLWEWRLLFVLMVLSEKGLLERSFGCGRLPRSGRRVREDGDGARAPTLKLGSQWRVIAGVFVTGSLNIYSVLSLMKTNCQQLFSN